MKFRGSDFIKRKLLPEEEIPFFYLLEILNLMDWGQEEKDEIVEVIRKYFPENLEDRTLCQGCLEQEFLDSLIPGNRQNWRHCSGEDLECRCLCSATRKEVELVNKLLKKDVG